MFAATELQVTAAPGAAIAKNEAATKTAIADRLRIESLQAVERRARKFAGLARNLAPAITDSSVSCLASFAAISRCSRSAYSCSVRSTASVGANVKTGWASRSSARCPSFRPILGLKAIGRQAHGSSTRAAVWAEVLRARIDDLDARIEEAESAKQLLERFIACRCDGRPERCIASRAADALC